MPAGDAGSTSDDDPDDETAPAGRDGVIGYLDVQRLEPLGYLGGVLVADEFGLPLEFRHTLRAAPDRSCSARSTATRSTATCAPR